MQKNENSNEENENLFNGSFFKRVKDIENNNISDSNNKFEKSIISTTDIPLDGSDKKSITEKISGILDSAIKDMEKNSPSDSIGRIVISRGGFPGLDPVMEEDSDVSYYISEFIRSFFGEDQLENFLVNKGYSISIINDGVETYKTATKSGVDTKDYDLYEICEYIEFPNIILKWLSNLDKN